MITRYLQGLSYHRNLSNDTAVATCAKHFMAYSDIRSGKDHTNSQSPYRLLLEISAPIFQTSINEGVPSIMASMGAIDC